MTNPWLEAQLDATQLNAKTVPDSRVRWAPRVCWMETLSPLESVGKCDATCHVYTQQLAPCPQFERGRLCRAFACASHVLGSVLTVSDM